MEYTKANSIITINNLAMKLYRDFLKPFFDLAFSLLLLLLVSPILFVLTIVLSLHFKGSPFFLHDRPGKYGHVFKVIKFKSMNDNVDLPIHERITRFGKFLRFTSLDELPQLINIIKGDMSFIGPRPLLTSYLPLYNDFQKRRHEVKPGITGWAQVNGRNAISWENKFILDVFYVDHISFRLDIKIIILTILKVIKREGVGVVGFKEGGVIYDSFKGTIE